MSALQDYVNRLNGGAGRATVSGPSGLRDAAPAQQRSQGGALQSYVSNLGGSFTQGQRTDMTGTYRNWYTGGNLNGTDNGWNTEFQRVSSEGYTRSLEQGKPFEMFARPDSTGVVTWDNAKGQGANRFIFGDVVVDGAKVGNVYEDFDQHTANVMMGEYMIQTGDRKADLNNAGDPEKVKAAWQTELTNLRANNNRQAEVYPRKQEFDRNVRREVESDPDREGIVAGGAGGGALLGGGIGFTVGTAVPVVGNVVGAAVGAGVGAVIGGIGAWLNSDSLAYQLARSQEQVKLASREGAGLQATLSAVAQNTMSIGLSPMSNLLQGTYDATRDGGVTGGTLGGEFHETNAEGDRKAGFAWQAADFGAMIADSALQFASPAGRLAYQAQMTTQISSGVMGLLPGQGVWDDTLLKQNSVWTRSEFNPATGKFDEVFDLGNSLAGIGAVGIDVVQLGAISSLSRGVDRLANQTAKATGQEPGRWAKALGGDRFLEKVNLDSTQRAALKAGTASIEVRSGYKFVVSDTGEIIGKNRGRFGLKPLTEDGGTKARATLSMLAPSEGLQAMSAKLLARRDAARRSGAVTAEELYQSASDLALGSKGLTAMLVNAVGEGQEEALQAVLEPWSQDHTVDAGSVIRAGLAGAATGFGMTAGARLGRPSQDLQMYALGRAGWASQTNGEVLTYEAWKNLDHLQQRTLVKSATGLTKALTDAAYSKIEADRINGVVGGVVEAAAAEDYFRDEDAAKLGKGALATDQASPIVMHESYTFRPEAMATSHGQLLQNQQDRTRGAIAQLEKLDTDIRKVDAAAAADPADTDLAARLAQMRDSHVELKEVLAASQRLESTIKLYVIAIDDAFERKDTPAAEKIIDGLNSTLEQMYDMTANRYDLADSGTLRPADLTDAEVLAFSKASSRLATRDPADSTASWQVMMPQVNKVWALRGANGLYGVSQIILKAVRGDYDGDKMRQLQQVVLDDEAFTALRSGTHILGVGSMPEIASTKFEKDIATKVMQAWTSTSDVLRDAAHRVGTDIESDLKIRYHNVPAGITPVPIEVIAEVAAEVNVALRTGGDVRAVVLDLMSRRAGNELVRVGRGMNLRPGQPKLSNEWFWMANMVTEHMQTFQSAFATYAPKKGNPSSNHDVVSPAQTTTDVRSTTPKRGGTEGSTIINELPGSNMFRMFQKLHYTLWESTEKYIGFAKDAASSEYMKLVQYYERLSQGKTVQRLERMSASDQILGDVMTWLEDMADDPAELDKLGLSELGNMALIANAAVPQMVWATDTDGTRRMKYTGKQVSIAQHLLYLSLEKFKGENAQVWDADADVRAAYNNLSVLAKPQVQGTKGSHPGNAEMAFVKVFESTRLYDIVGTSAVSLGVQRTVGQVYRELMSLSVEERKEQKYRLRSGEYADAEKGFTIPFGATELHNDSVTAYKSLVDSLFSAADSSLTKNLTGKDRGKVHGRMVDRSDQRGEAIRETYDAVQALLQRLEPRTSYTAADVSRIANEYREFGTALMKVIPKQTMPWVIKKVDENGKVTFASWFYEVWTQPTAVQAEMSYFRNLVTNSWFAKVRNLDIDFSNSDGNTQKKIAFDSLDSRMHQLMFRLASNSVTQTVIPSDQQAHRDLWGMQQFLAKLDEAQSVEKFMKWLNSEEGLVTDGAPLLPWMDDVAEFDPTRAGGGWSSQLSTPTLMEHVNSLKATAHRMIGDLGHAATRADADVNTARAVERWHKHRANPNDQDLVADPDDEIIYNRFVELLKKSASRRMSNGPRAMLQHTAHLVHGMYAPAHAKGANPEQMAANAALEHMDNAFGYLITAERVLGDLTAHNEESVASAPQMILRDGGRTMNRYGAQVEWEMNSVDAMLPLMLDPAKHNMMRAVLFDTVVELDSDNVARRKFLMGSTLDEVMTNNTVKDLFGVDKNPDLAQSMKFLVKMDQKLRGTQKHVLEQKVTELVLARTTALDHTATFEEIQSMTVQAYMDFAAVLQVVGRTKLRDGDNNDPVHEAHRRLKEAAMVATISKTYNVDPSAIQGSLTQLRTVIEQMMLEPYQDRVKRVVDQLLDTSIQGTQRTELRAKLVAEERVLAGMEVKIERMFDLNVTESIVAQYHYSTEADEDSRLARQTELMKYVYEHGELVQAAGPALVTVQAIRNHFGDTPQAQKLEPLLLPEKEWEELSNVIISVEIQHLLTVSPASKPPPPYPGALKSGVKGLDKSKYWDHSFSYLFDFLSEDDESGILTAARELAVEGGHVVKEFDQDDVAKKVADTLLRPHSLGQWTPSVVIQSIESYELLQGASANPSISMHGLLSRRWGAAMQATQRQHEAGAVADTVVTLTPEDLDWMKNGQFHDVEVFNTTNSRPYKRPLAWLNNRFAEELTFTYTLPGGAPVGGGALATPGAGSPSPAIDLMNRPNVARTWLPADGTAAATQFKEVNITRLREEVELYIKELHPSADHDTLQEMFASAKVGMRFVNPDSQPSDKGYANSVWHEGTVYYSAGDNQDDSLITAFFFGVGGLNPRGQQAALDTRKLALSGIEDYPRTAFDKVREIEQDAGTDFGRMIALKTKEWMDTPISDGKPVDVHFYNAAYKIMKLKHWVDGTLRGTDEKVRWSAEMVIEWQVEHPGVDLFTDAASPLVDAKLWIPSDQVLADMMGDIGLGGVRGRLLKDVITDDLSSIPMYESVWTKPMEDKFSVDVEATDLSNTDAARQSFVQDLRVSSYVTPQEQMRFQRRVEAMHYRMSRALLDRRDASQRTTFDPVANGKKNMDTAMGWVSALDLKVNMPKELEYLSRENGDIQLRTLQALDQYMKEQVGRAANAGSSYWIFQETGTSSAEEGLLTKGDLTGGLSLVPGEVVFLDTSAYQDMDPKEARDLAMKRVEFFVNRGVALMIGASKGPNSLIAEVQTLTKQQHGYQRYMNNNNILVPDVFDESSFQNVAAARSRLTAPSGVAIGKQRLTMLLRDQEIEENAMWVPVRPGRKTKFDTIQAIFDLLPIDVNARFNSPNTRDEALKVQQYLEGPGIEAMMRQESLRHLFKDGDPTKLGRGVTAEQVNAEGAAFDQAWQNLRLQMPTRVRANTTAPLVGEKFGTGDFIPLINVETNELMLYRHGYTYPEPADYRRQLANQVPGMSGPRGIVMYSGEIEPGATTHVGTVSGINPSPGRGFLLELEVPVQELGEKLVFEHNGMKFMKTNLPAKVKVPDLALFGDIEIDGFASLHDVISKEATDGLVSSFQQAFALFGVDFTQDIKSFFGMDNTSDAIGLLRKIARFGNKMSVEEVYELQSLLAGTDSYFSAISGVLPTLSASGVDISGWSTRIEDTTAEAAIARAMIIYLLSPSADVEAILGSSGFFVDNPSLAGAQSQRMPELFTRSFDLSAPDSAVRAELGARINLKLNEGGGESWHLDVNSWELEGIPAGGVPIRGMLQFGEAHVSDDNPLLNLMAQGRKDAQSMTRHQGLMNRIGTGGLTRSDNRSERLTAIRQQDLTDPDQLGSLWRDMTFVDPATYGPGSRWQRRGPAEHMFYNKSIMRFTQYRHAIDFDDAVFDEDRPAIVNAITSIGSRLGLRPSQSELVHYWIRQMLYHPAEGGDQEAFSGDLSPKDVLGATRSILGNLDRGYLPTYDGAGPSFFAYDDLAILFHAHQRGENKSPPWRKEGDRGSALTKDSSIGDWISIAFAQAINEDVDFDPIYRLDMAGFMNTYQSVLRNSGYMMDVTFDKEYQGRLLDPKSNELLSVTLDPVQENRLTQQVILATAGLEYDDLMRGAATSDDANSQAQAAAWRSRRLKTRARWRARHKVRPVKVQSSRDFIRNGTELINKDADMHSLQRIVIALRHGTAMLNPGLYFSMIPEQGFRMLLSEATNALTGESTLRSVAGAQRGVERLASAVTGGRLNLELAQYTGQQVSDLNDLFKQMGNDGAFTSLIISDMMWHRPDGSPGKIVRGFERYAAIGNKWQDPTWGTTQKALARHYVEAIVREIESAPTRYAMTIDSAIAHLRTDPAYFAKHHPDMHERASNFVVDFRSLKNTPWSLAMKGMYEPWSRSENMGKRFVGTIIKLQAMYATYNMNVLTTMTGMQGYTAMASIFLDGAKKPGSLMRLFMKARNGEPITDEDYETFDMSSAIDGVNIANAFIRGGVTQTGLFMLGMAAGGVLSGEDDEAKRRRRLAQAQNAPLIMDPRRLELDFRNKDVLFLDWLPPQMSAFFRVQEDDGVQGARSMAQMSWLVKPFMSPILGMERFFMTGDFHYVVSGFQDAVSSLPLFNANRWDDAVRTAHELEQLAADEQKNATPTSMKNAMYLLTSAVAVFENMLVENAFVNSIYTGLDMYDRDPTRLVLRDSDGDPQRTIENDNRPNDLAMQDYIGPDGKTAQGYMKRSAMDANLAAYTENHFTAAAVMSIFTGFKKEYLRSDMPVRMRSIDIPELEGEEAKIAVVLATLNGQKKAGTLERQLSLDEVTAALKGQFLKAKNWDAYNNLDALAKQFYESDANPKVNPMSIIGPDGQEVLTRSGHAALFKGLMGGTITMDDLAMRGIGITVDARKEIEKEFFKDFAREGVDLGLTQSQANSRAKRLMFGPIDDPSIIGFKDVLWDKRIPYNSDIKYKQLNTTYVQGPDGFPWATGFKRGGAPGAGGFASLFGGLKRPTLATDVTDSMAQDGRMNSADRVNGINTGMRGVVPFNATENIPTDLEQTKMIVDAIGNQPSPLQTYEPNNNGGGGGKGFFYRGRNYGGGFRRFGGGGGFGGGGKGYSPTIYWSRQPTLPRGTNVFGNSAKNLFWNNANIRRTTIRRERYQSERGRLNQWQ